jgi:hypothetical protein
MPGVECRSTFSSVVLSFTNHMGLDSFSVLKRNEAIATPVADAIVFDVNTCPN